MTDDRTREQRSDAPKQGKDDAKAMLTNRPAEGAGPRTGEPSAARGSSEGSDAALRSDTRRAEAAPGGTRDSGAAGDDLAQNEMPDSASPVGAVAGNEGAEGSLGTGNYSDYGRVTGPDSPAGDQADLQRQAAEAQGDALADRLGGGEGRGIGMTGAGAATGDMSAGGSSRGGGELDEERAAASKTSGGRADAPDAGEPGGMGGAGATTNASSRPPGGESPARED